MDLRSGSEFVSTEVSTVVSALRSDRPAGWLMVPTSVMMAATTFLTTRFHRRSLRHVWLVVEFVGTAAHIWWLSSIDNFRPEEHSWSCWAAGGRSSA